MMATIEKRDAPLVTKRPDQTDPPDDSTVCAYCSSSSDVYAMGADEWICSSHLASSVALAASVWGDMVNYSRQFESEMLL